jgi:hypothetical protein
MESRRLLLAEGTGGVTLIREKVGLIKKEGLSEYGKPLWNISTQAPFFRNVDAFHQSRKITPPKSKALKTIAKKDSHHYKSQQIPQRIPPYT